MEISCDTCKYRWKSKHIPPCNTCNISHPTCMMNWWEPKEERVVISLEVGKWYADRVGNPYKCVHEIKGKHIEYPFICIDVSEVEAFSYARDGKYMIANVDSLDLTREIPEPREK